MATWTAQRVAHHGILTLHGDVSQVFPLFGFDQEDRWADGWAYHPVYPADGRAEANAVFMTDAHDHAATSAIWVVIRYEPEQAEVAYVRVEPGVKVGCVTIACRAGEPGLTQASVAYMYTALGEAGNAFIADFTEAHYRHMLQQWEFAINLCLREGR